MNTNSACRQDFAYPKNVQEVSEQVKPHYDKAQDVQVVMQLDKSILKEFVEVEFTAITVEAGRSGIELPFTASDFQRYCNTFIVSRVAWVNGDMHSVIIRPEEHVMCPALLDAVCKNIGIVVETSQGLTLKPAIEGKVEVMSHDEMLKVSFFLHSMPNYVGGTGYIKDKSGSWEFMSMQLVQTAILSESAVHPAFSLLASIVGPKWLGAATAPRIKYGDLTIYKSLLWQLTSC